MGGRSRHHRVRAEEREERRRLRGHPRRGHAVGVAVGPAGQGRRRGRDARENHRARRRAESRTRRPRVQAKEQIEDGIAQNTEMMPAGRLLATALAAAATLAPRQDVLTQVDIDVTITEGTDFAAAASPDRRSIAIDLLGSLWIVPFGGGDARKITPDLLEARQPSWSPDGRALAFAGVGDDGVSHIYAIGVDGGRMRQLTIGPFDDREPDWSHDGTRIEFSPDRRGGIRSSWICEVESGDVRQASPMIGTHPTLRPDDGEIMFLGRRTEEAWTRIGPRQPETPSLWAAAPGGAERPVWRTSGIPAWDP